jgi:hypothetical protein
MLRRLAATSISFHVAMLVLAPVASSGCSGGNATVGAAGSGAGAPAGSGNSGSAGGSGGSGGSAGAAVESGVADGAGSTAAEPDAAGAGTGSGAGGDGGSTAADADAGGPGSSGGSGDAADGAAPGADAGAKNCAGNAISLGANGTGTDSDAARARIVIDLTTDLPIGNANRTIEFWAYIKPTDWVGEKNEIYVYGDLGVQTGAFGLDFGTFAVNGMPDNHATLNPVTGGGFNDDSTNYLGITSTSSQWVHIAMTWDGTVVRTYVNGDLRITSKGMGGATKLATVSSALTVGCNPPYYNCFNGYYDDLRFWNTTRSDAEIKGNYDATLVGDEAGLVGYWKFDEAAGATAAADSVTTAGHTAHPGVLMSAMAAGHPTFVTPSPPAPIFCR